MEGFLAFGFLVGMGHALEADHLAAVAAMAVGRKSARRLALVGAVWGAGHTITLFALCSAVILFGFVLTERAAAALEFAVAIMLVVLGIDVLRRMRRAKLHFHVHDRGDGHRHIHAHSHLGSRLPHHVDPHHHAHRRGFPLRALLVGLVHGAAGSAALLALALAAAQDASTALLFVLLFGVGSILGMTALSLATALPLGLAERGARWFHRGVHAAIAFLAISLGLHLMLETGPVVWAGV